MYLVSCHLEKLQQILYNHVASRFNIVITFFTPFTFRNLSFYKINAVRQLISTIAARALQLGW